MKTQLASDSSTRALADNQVVIASTKTPYWVAIAAALLTTTTLAALTIGSTNSRIVPDQINGISVVDLPAVEVYAQTTLEQINGISVVDLPAVAVYAETAARQDINVGISATANVYVAAAHDSAVDRSSTGNFIHHSLAPQLQRMGSAGMAEGFSLLNSQLAMPYYSFGKQLSTSSKE